MQILAMCSSTLCHRIMAASTTPSADCGESTGTLIS